MRTYGETMNFSDFNLDGRDKYYLIILFVIAFLSTLKMTLFCLAGGILNPDISLYLISALKYAGMDYYNIANPADLYYTPVISFLTSLLFRAGMVSHSAIIIVTSIFAFLAYIGLYVLLRSRFNPLLSLAGVIIYGSFSLVLFNMCKGMIDIPSVSISIWILIFAIMATDKNPKYWLIALPLFAVGFFVKYTVGFMLPLIILYYLMDKDIFAIFDELISDRKHLKQSASDYIKSMEFRYILASVFISAVLGLVICKALILDFGGSLTFLGQSTNTFNGYQISQNAIHYVLDKSMYLDDLPRILFQQRDDEMNILTNILLGIIILGLLIKLVNMIKNRGCLKDAFANRQSFKTRYLEVVLVLMFILAVIGMFVGFKKFSNHMTSNICCLIAITIAYSLLLKLNVKSMRARLFLLFLAYFAINFIFLSLYQIKVYRYFLVVVPPLIYFIVWGLESIMDAISNGFDAREVFKSKLVDTEYRIDFSRASKILLVGVLLVFVASTLYHFAPMEMNDQNEFYPDAIKQGFVTDLMDACQYIKDSDSDYHNATFAATNHNERTVRWYLNINGTIIHMREPRDFDNATYIIFMGGRNFHNYDKVHTVGDFNVYRHK